MPGLQQLPDLQNAEFLPIYLQSRILNQADQANQFNQTGLQQNQADLESKTLQNLFDRQNDPMRLESQRLQNEQQSMTNENAGITLGMRKELLPEEKKAKAAEYLKTQSDAALADFMAKAKLDMMSDDPNVAKAGRNKYMMSAEEQSARVKHQEAMERQSAQIASNEKIAAGHDDTTLKAADIRAKSASGGSAMPRTFDGLINYWAQEAQMAAQSGDMVRHANANQMLQVIQQAQSAKPAVQSQGMKDAGQIDLSGKVPLRPNTAPAPVQIPAPGGASPSGGAPGQPNAPKMDPAKLQGFVQGAKQRGWTDAQIERRLKELGYK